MYRRASGGTLKKRGNKCRSGQEGLRQLFVVGAAAVCSGCGSRFVWLPQLFCGVAAAIFPIRSQWPGVTACLLSREGWGMLKQRGQSLAVNRGGQISGGNGCFRELSGKGGLSPVREVEGTSFQNSFKTEITSTYLPPVT